MMQSNRAETDRQPAVKGAASPWDEHVRKGAASARQDPRSRVKCAERPEVSGNGAVSPKPGYRRSYGEETKSVSEASVLNREIPEDETARGTVRDLDRPAEPVWARRQNGVAAGIPSRPADGAPWGKADRLRIHGSTIGTSEPGRDRRSVAGRLAFRSREMVTSGGRVPVVVRDRESRLHGEGEQVLRRLAVKEK